MKLRLPCLRYEVTLFDTERGREKLIFHTQLRTDYGWFQVNKHGTGDVFASTGLAEESVETVVARSDGLVRGHLAIRLDTVLQAVQFPAGISDLDSGLANVD